MAYTTSGQLPVGQSFRLGDYTFDLAVNSTGVIATINDGEKGAAKGASFRDPKIASWSVEANEKEASVYVRLADEPTTYPDYISIVQPPYKLTYKNYEPIDLTGLVVQAYNEDGTVWTCNQYPNGIIPVGEITASPNTAESGLAPYGTIHTNVILNGTRYETKIFLCDYFYAKCAISDVNPYWKSIEVMAQNGFQMIIAPDYYSTTSDTYYAFFIAFVKKVGIADPIYGENILVANIKEIYQGREGIEENIIQRFSGSPIYEYDEKKCRGNAPGLYYNFDVVDRRFDTLETNIPFNKTDFYYYGPRSSPWTSIAYYAYLHASPQQTLDITLNWNRPVDKKTLSDSYKITTQ